MAVQQNKKSPSKRGMHRAHAFLCRSSAGRRAGERRSAFAPPYQSDRLLPRQKSRQDQSRRITPPPRPHAASRRCSPHPNRRRA